MPDITLTSKTVRIAEDEAKWLSTAAAKGNVTQNDLLRLALNRLRKDLGAATRLKPESVTETAKASRFKLTPPRVAAAIKPAAAAKPAAAIKPAAAAKPAAAIKPAAAAKPAKAASAAKAAKPRARSQKAS
jgi:hypothetical protein